jgi:hypothetical protein
MTTSDFLMCILILVTGFIGYVSYGIQKEIVELQRLTHQSWFVPILIEQPKVIDESTRSKVGISNVGYIAGNYKIKIRSKVFRFETEKFESGKEISFSFILEHGGNSDHEFNIIPPTKGKLPTLASYEILYTDNNDFHLIKKHCFQLKNGSSYAAVRCHIKPDKRVTK